MQLIRIRQKFTVRFQGAGIAGNNLYNGKAILVMWCQFQAESLPCQEVELALFKQFLVTATESLLQDRHSYEYTD